MNIKYYVKEGFANKRASKGYSINLLARLTGMSPSGICRLENGINRCVRPSNAFKISYVLGMQLEDLFIIESKSRERL